MINAEFNPLISINGALAITQHELRAFAYKNCCDEKDSIEKDRLKNFVDHYGATEEQMKIIHQCVADSSNSSFSCKSYLSNLQGNLNQMNQ